MTSEALIVMAVSTAIMAILQASLFVRLEVMYAVLKGLHERLSSLEGAHDFRRSDSRSRTRSHDARNSSRNVFGIDSRRWDTVRTIWTATEPKRLIEHCLASGRDRRSGGNRIARLPDFEGVNYALRSRIEHDDYNRCR